jgi:hypothetical protein
LSSLDKSHTPKQALDEWRGAEIDGVKELGWRV